MSQVNKVAAKIQNRFKGMMVCPEKTDSKQNKNGTIPDNLAVFQITLQEYTSVVL